MKNSRVPFWVSISALSLLIAAALLYSCSGGGGTAGGGASDSGTVAVYATGNSFLNSNITSTATGTNLDSGGTSTAEGNGNSGHSLFTGITVTITGIELVNKGTGTNCTVLNEPLSLGIVDISNIMHLITEADCPAASYNRVRITFERDFFVEDSKGNGSLCTLTSSKGSGDRPDVLLCSGSSCTLEINGAVNVLVQRRNSLALNLNLKEFDVSGIGNPETCTVTLKTSPICESEDEMENLPESISGLVSHLSTSAQTFDLTRGHRTYPVLYSGITSSQQPGIEEVLQHAQDEALGVNVLSSGASTTGGPIIASALSMKIEGVVSNLDAAKRTCTVTYRNGSAMEITYQDSAGMGTLKDGAGVRITITGYDGDRYIASNVAANIDESATDD